MVRSAGTVEYGAAILADAGALLSSESNPPSFDSLCSLERASNVHLPFTPFLLQSTWLTSPTLTSGLRLDLTLEFTLALALWQKTGIGSFALPSSPSKSARSICPETSMNRENTQWILNNFFPLVNTAGLTYKTSEDLLSGKGQDRIGFIVSSVEDFFTFKDLICTMSNQVKGLVEVLSFGIDSESLRLVQTQNFPCHFRIRPLRLNYPELLGIGIAFFVQEEFGIEVFLRGLSEPGLVKIGLPRSEVSQMSWIGTLSTQALKGRLPFSSHEMSCKMMPCRMAYTQDRFERYYQ